ncbi:MAG: aminopeptidase [Pseudomonadota bacterium]|jgi:predicted aminopeptidase|nr:MAG: aminopeptidase [Pseudomonadota bacterium]
MVQNCAAGRLVLLAAALLQAGCGLGYYAQAARGQFAIMRARQPVERLIDSPGTSDTLRQQLVRARRIRDFASSELGLPDNGAYRSYADIGRRYVVWNVVATPEFSIEPRQWCFPVAGCVAYRGYFSEKAAQAFAARRREEGDDVFVGGVPAYSTLGRFADPLLNTVTGYGELDLAALIFHELAHQVLYVPGDSAFNEAFATAVEEEGVARYAAAHVGEEALAEWRLRRQLRVEVTGAFIRARGDLAALYRRDLPPAAMREQKAARLRSLADEVLAIERRLGRASGYRGWIDSGLNNAHLAAVATYYDRVPEFERILRERCGGYLPCLYVEARSEARNPRRE